MRPALLFLTLFALIVWLAARPVLDLVDRVLNRTTTAPSAPPESVLSLHDSLWIADFHNDALLWNRDLRERAMRGHVDIPRLQAGGFELAVFSVTSRHYLASNYERTPPFIDVLPLAAIAMRWPRSTWFDPFQRALWLAREMRTTAGKSGGRLRLIQSRADLDLLLDSQARGDSVVGALLLLEGMHALDGRLASIDSLFAAGFRVFGIAHMFDNDVGGSAHGWNKGGLTPFGRRAVARVDSLGGIIDLAHASRATIDDVLSLTSHPVVVSHTGLTSACPGTRNLPDDVVRRIAEHGGLVAIGFWNAAVCGKDAAAIARSIHRAIDVAGADHVALGSDFDGAVATPFDAAHLSMLTAALIAEGLTPAQIRQVMGENQKRFLLARLH
jgi:membrane dipeptidase